MKNRFRLLLAVAVMVAVAGIAAYVISGGSDADIGKRAASAGALLGLFGTLAAGVRWAWTHRHPPLPATSTSAQVSDAVDLLAKRTFKAWSEELVRRGIQNPSPVRVRWRWAGDDIALSRQDLLASVLLSTDPGPLPGSHLGGGGADQILNSGMVTRLHDEVYAHLRHGRLVLVGGAGVGKTGAMILLLLEALTHRDHVSPEDRAAVPVPMWLTLGSWDPGSQGLREWVTATMAVDHPYLRAAEFGADAIGQMFDSGRIALFLDGLDEMPEVFLRRAVERLTGEAGRLRLVLTSRPEQYRATVDRGGQLPFSAVVELHPVGVRAAVRYLLDGQIGPARRAWTQVTDHLQAHPDGVLARTLNTPLTLSLARSAYSQADPSDLLAPQLDTEQALRGHLLDQVLMTAYPDQPGRAHAAYWLGWCAHHMNTRPGGPTRDLRWWDIPAWLPRMRTRSLIWLAWILGLLTVGLFIGFLFGLVAALVGGLLGGLGGWLLARGGVGLRDKRRHKAPRATAFRRPTWRELRSGLVAGLRGWLVAGLVGLLPSILTSGLVSLGIPLVIGLIAGMIWLLIWLIENVWSVPIAASPALTPRSAYHKDLQAQLMSGIVFGLTLGLATGLLTWVAAGLVFAAESRQDPLLLGLLAGLFVGILVALASGLIFGLSAEGAASNLLYTEIALYLRRRKVRFMPLLETALRLQVLRQAGAVYQFRHADLQDRLADRYRQEHLI